MKATLLMLALISVATLINTSRVALISLKVMEVEDTNLTRAIVRIMRSLATHDHSMRQWLHGIYMPPMNTSDQLQLATFCFLVIWAMLSVVCLAAIVASFVPVIILTTLFYLVGTVGEFVNLIFMSSSENSLYLPFIVNLITTEILILYLVICAKIPANRGLRSKIKEFTEPDRRWSPCQVANKKSMSPEKTFHETPI